MFIRTLHKYRIYLYILLCSFAFIFSSLDKFPFGGDDKLQHFMSSEISFKNYHKYQFIVNNIDNINLNCEDLPYTSCGQLFRVRASFFTNYLYVSKVLYLFDTFLGNKKTLYDSKQYCLVLCDILDPFIGPEYTITRDFINISKTYNYSILGSYLFIFFLSLIFILRSDVISYYYITIFLLSILITNHHLFNFNLFYFSDFFHKNPKWGTFTELEPKGILVFLFLASLIFYIKSSFVFLFLTLFLMVFIHWGQSIFLQFYFVIVFGLNLLCNIFFEKKIKFFYFICSVLVFILSYISLSFFYVKENDVNPFLFDFIRYTFSLDFLLIYFSRIIFYSFLIIVTFNIIKNIKTPLGIFQKYLKNFLILGLSSLILLELLFYLDKFNNNIFTESMAENEFTLIYGRVLGNIYFVEFIFLLSLLFIYTKYLAKYFAYSLKINFNLPAKNINIFLCYIFSIFIFIFIFISLPGVNIKSGLEKNIENSKILSNKFSISYYNKITYKIKNIPYEFFFTICGEQEVNLLDKNKILKCKTTINYIKIKKYIHLDSIKLSDEIQKLNIDPKYPYVYILQLNSWYKQ